MGALLTNKELYYFDLIEGELSCEEAAGREVSRRERERSLLLMLCRHGGTRLVAMMRPHCEI